MVRNRTTERRVSIAERSHSDSGYAEHAFAILKAGINAIARLIDTGMQAHCGACVSGGREAIGVTCARVVAWNGALSGASPIPNPLDE